jgi:TatD DNase family protein
MFRYYNIHTHSRIAGDDSLAIVNAYDHFETMHEVPACSMGLHPWYLDNAQEQMMVLDTYARSANVLAIGECGLDRVQGASWDQQLSFFEQQIILAMSLQKPLIIHCVRAHDEVLRLLADHKVNVPVVFHGFNGRDSIAQRILNAGCYLSLGAALLRPTAPAAILLSHLSANQFFLETDDATVSIKDLYRIAAQIRKTEEEAIILQLQQNFKNVFGV